MFDQQNTHTRTHSKITIHYLLFVTLMNRYQMNGPDTQRELIAIFSVVFFCYTPIYRIVVIVVIPLRCENCSQVHHNYHQVQLLLKIHKTKQNKKAVEKRRAIERVSVCVCGDGCLFSYVRIDDSIDDVCVCTLSSFSIK